MQIDRLLGEAEEAAALKDWETVRDRAEHALTCDPQNADGIAFLAAADRALSGSAPQPTTQPATSTPSTSVPPLAGCGKSLKLRVSSGVLDTEMGPISLGWPPLSAAC